MSNKDSPKLTLEIGVDKVDTPVELLIFVQPFSPDASPAAQKLISRKSIQPS